MLRSILLILILSTVLFINCNNDNEKYEGRYAGLEYHRQLAFEEYRAQANSHWIDSVYYSMKYRIPDTISQSDPRMKYVKENTNIPQYIIRAIFERQHVPLLTINEWFLSRPDMLRDLKAGIITIIVPSRFDDKIYMGYTRYYNKRINFFTGGSLWVFKYGFLWEAGTI